MQTDRTRNGRLWQLVSATMVCVLVLFGCPPTQNVNLDESSATSKTIGPEGGTITSTAGNGTIYTLDVPANALAEPVEITITPVTDIRDLPLSGGFAGAVDLQPAGLEFSRSAILTIIGAPGAPLGMIPIGFSYEGDADTLELAIAGEEGDALTLLVQHFSGGGVGFGTLQDVSALSVGGGSACEAPLSDLIELSVTSHELEEEVSVFRDFFAQCVLPDLENANSDAELKRAVFRYEVWARDISVSLGLTLSPATASEFTAERQEAADAAAEKIRAAIAGNNDVAAAQQSFSAVANVLFWQKQAELFDMDLQAEQLSRETVLLSIPLDIQMDPVTLPATIQDGFPHSLDLQFSVVFQGHADTPQAAPMRIDLTATGATLQNPSGFTSVDGLYTTVITATGAGDVGVNIQACLVLPVAPPPPPAQPTTTDLCFHDFVGAQSVNLTGHWTGDVVGQFTGSPVVVNGTLSMDLIQNQNAISGTYRFEVSGVTLSGTVSAILTSDPEVDALNLSVSTSFTDCTPRGGQFTGSALIRSTGENTFELDGGLFPDGCIAETLSSFQFLVRGPT